jgi:hypothetical protein
MLSGDRHLNTTRPPIETLSTMNLKEHMQMPVETHGTAASAVHQVTGIFLTNHCAVDQVQPDYGEDLLIQPSFREQIEHFKIWVQVKGTTNIGGYRQASGDIVRYIDFAHMYKWLRSKELCVLVLWDIQKQEGLFYLPKDELSEWDFYTERKATIRVVFNENNVLTSQTLPPHTRLSESAMDSPMRISGTRVPCIYRS